MTLVTPPSGPDFDVTDYEALAYYRREPGFVVHDGTSGPLSPAPVVPSWLASVSYAAGQVVQHPTSTDIYLRRIAQGVSRGSFDATEAALWKASGSATYATVVETPPTPERHGATGNGVADDTAAVAAWLAAGYTGAALKPGSVYLTSTGVTLPASLAYVEGNGATVKASAAMDSVLNTAIGTLASQQAVRNVKLDCNNGLATHGFYLPYSAHFTLDKPTVISPGGDGYVIGDPLAAGASYEFEARDLYLYRPPGQAVPAGSRGLWMQYVQDSRIHGRSIIVGADIGVRTDRGSNKFFDVHVWGQPGHLPSICFDDNSDGNTYYACHGDTPTSQCFRMRTFRSVLIEPHAYVGLAGTDNTVTGIYYDLAAPNAAVINPFFEGADGTHRLAKDVDGAFGTWVNNVELIGVRWAQVVTQNVKSANSLSTARVNGLLAVLADNADAFGVRATDGTYVLNVNTNSGSRRVEAWNGSDVRGTSDAGTTEVWKIVGANGLIKAGRFTTAGRPTGAARVTGGIGYDTDIQTYIYWDGTNWRNFANAIV